jgi:hypothetical protein
MDIVEEIVDPLKICNCMIGEFIDNNYISCFNKLEGRSEKLTEKEIHTKIHELKNIKKDINKLIPNFADEYEIYKFIKDRILNLKEFIIALNYQNCGTRIFYETKSLDIADKDILKLLDGIIQFLSSMGIDIAINEQNLITYFK